VPLTTAINEADFIAEWPEYESTRELDRLRETEYSRLDRLGHTYLDYTGAGLYGTSQVRDHLASLESNVFGNPHSHNPTSLPASELVERVRSKVLAYFRASPDEYVPIFTANASTALKLIGESYPFEPGDHYLLTFDNHNSVNGIREFARARGAGITYVPLDLADLRVDERHLDEALTLSSSGTHNLFAYPAQSNFSGVQHPLSWIGKAQARGWEVLLDAAAFVPTNALDLSRWHPDFVTLSFYKMFGYPTGVGCLIARREALAHLHRPWFSGGTITVASVQGDRYFLADGASAFEDGTLDYLNIPAVEIGLHHLETADVARIHTRIRCLTGWLLRQLLALRHASGVPLVRLYGPADLESRGATITMNFYDAGGAIIDHLLVERLATERGISLRTGCFCNPGGGETALNLSKNEIVGCFNQPRVQETAHFTVDDFRLCVDGKSTGAVRVSFGIASNFADAARFVEFVRTLQERHAHPAA
jgi:selenocysteine lyase/cysteine desulfurase